MSLGEILMISFALAIDAFTVALAGGVSLQAVGVRRTVRLAWHFGLFQTGMTLIGWSAGLSVRALLENVDHWLAMGLLGMVGGRMIYNSLIPKKEEAPTADPTKGGTLVMLSVATSIDALAVGIGFSMLKIEIWTPALIIGVMAFVLTAFGMQLGRVIKGFARIGRWAELAGGVVLLLIGLRILYDHGVY
ncbi:MAG: manganese efflux pump [Myxococcales bacterium]|nr:manganese efflux pump [Myxococcales bacterium]